MNYENRIAELLKEYMTERGFKLWTGINGALPNIWNKPTSSTGKYHQKEGGRVPDVAEHTFEMLFAASKLLKMFDINKNTSEADSIMFAIALHDSLKYGETGDREHTDNKHDHLVGNMIESNKSVFMKILSENQYSSLHSAVKYHSGRWSTDATPEFNFNSMTKEVLFVHMLDMMSTADLIKLKE